MKGFIFLGNLIIIFIAKKLQAHMIMRFPAPRGSIHNTLYQPIDYNLKSPLTDLNLCKNKPPGPAVITVGAGDVIKVAFEGTARHGGGICQFSLSYDDKKFFLIQEYDGSCPDSNILWPVRIPSHTPSCDRCTFGWSWINAIGNREFYMNCADIKIIGRPDLQRPLDGPLIKLANLPGYAQQDPPADDGGISQNKIQFYNQ